MNKLSMESKNIINNNIEYIRDKFPNVVVETKNGFEVDFNLLKQELSNIIVDENKEKYQLTWPGKKEAILTANTTTKNILRPIKEKSVDFDNTENIYIEGDNLEALKILQESYLNKIKCIYIDPPYNTGKDFIYNDKFNKKSKEELLESGQIDVNGNRLLVNNQSNGRFHSDWLSMMYSRLKLARNLLTLDGTIFLSIDDSEVYNLIEICNEIFGENLFISAIPRIASFQRSGQEKYMNISHDYILVYSRDNDFKNVTERIINTKKVMQDKNGIYVLGDTKAIVAAQSQGYSQGGDYDFEYNGKIYSPIDSNGKRNRWLWKKTRMEAAAKLGILVETRNSLRMQLYIDKKFEEGTNIMVPKSEKLKFHTADFMNSKFDNPLGTKELKELFEGYEYFDNPKPSILIKYLIDLSTGKNDIVLDFFSGSATTANSVIKLNSEDNNNRKYIMVQLPEICDEKSEAFKNGYKTICEIGEERIRRAAKKIKEETNADIDYGFRVYKVDSSNMKEVYYKPNEINQEQLKMFETNIKEDRTNEDLLTQVILDLGLTLDLKISEKEILNNKLYFVDDNSLVACFDDTINIDIVNEICKINPLKVVFKDSSFKRDEDKINLSERFKKLSPETELSVI